MSAIFLRRSTLSKCGSCTCGTCVVEIFCFCHRLTNHTTGVDTVYAYKSKTFCLCLCICLHICDCLCNCEVPGQSQTAPQCDMPATLRQQKPDTAQVHVYRNACCKKEGGTKLYKNTLQSQLLFLQSIMP